MDHKNFFQKDWPKIKSELENLSDKARNLAKIGEAHLRKISLQGKAQIDISALNLKKEHLYLRIGQEYVRMKCPGPHSAKLTQFIKEIRKIEKELASLRNRLRTGSKT